jgi:hypothetical protein
MFSEPGFWIMIAGAVLLAFGFQSEYNPSLRSLALHTK